MRLLARVTLVRMLARVTPALQLLRHTSVRLCIHDNIYVDIYPCSHLPRLHQPPFDRHV